MYQRKLGNQSIQTYLKKLKCFRTIENQYHEDEGKFDGQLTSKFGYEILGLRFQKFESFPRIFKDFLDFLPFRDFLRFLKIFRMLYEIV